MFPVDVVVFLLCVLDDGGFVPVAMSVAGLVFLESGVEVSSCLSDVNFTAVTGDLVYAGFPVGGDLVLVCV